MGSLLGERAGPLACIRAIGPIFCFSLLFRTLYLITTVLCLPSIQVSVLFSLSRDSIHYHHCRWKVIYQPSESVYEILLGKHDDSYLKSNGIEKIHLNHQWWEINSFLFDWLRSLMHNNEILLYASTV